MNRRVYAQLRPRVTGRSAFAWLTCACLVLAVLLHIPAVTCARQPLPNIVLAMADDQGWGDVGFRDHQVLKTPIIDAMAANSLLLERCCAATPVCSPTRGGIVTGRHPNRFGCFSEGYTLRSQQVTNSEALQQAGYATGHFGKWPLASLRADSPVCLGCSTTVEL